MSCYKKRKAMQSWHSNTAIGKILQEKYNTFSIEEQEKMKKENIKELIGAVLIFFGLCAVVVLMLLVG